MKTHRMGWLAISLLVAVLALGAACGGDDDSGNGDSGGNGNDGGAGQTATPTSSDNGNANGETPEATTDSGGSGDNNGGGTNSADALAKLRETAANLDTQTYRVVYDMTGTGIDGTFTLASNPPTQMFSIEGTVEGQSGTLMIISDDESTHVCTDFGGSQQCLKIAAGDQSSLPFTLPDTFRTDKLAEQVLDVPGVSVNDAGSREIAGVNADCYDVSSDQGDSTFCVGNNTLLLIDGSYEGQQFHMEATEYTDNPGPIEVPDWPVTDLSGTGG